MSRIAPFAGMLVLMGLSACATVGHTFNVEAIPKLQPGVTTEAQAIELLEAPPINRTTQLQAGNPPTWEPGDYFLGWMIVQGSAFGAHGHSLVLMFNKAGVLKEIVRQANL